MPTRLYHIESPGSAQLQITWDAGWRNTTISLDQTPLHVIPAFQELQTGQTLSLPDGSQLALRVARPYRERDLIVTLNSARLYGRDPALPNTIRVTFQTLFVLAGLFILLGLAALLFLPNILVRVGIGAHSIIIGAIFLLLGMFVRRHSLPAIILAVVLLGTHWLIGISIAGELGTMPHPGITLLHLFFAIPLFRGIFALDAWRRQFPPPTATQQKRTFWRNAAVLIGVLLLPLIVFVVLLFVLNP